MVKLENTEVISVNEFSRINVRYLINGNPVIDGVDFYSYDMDSLINSLRVLADHLQTTLEQG